MVLVQKWSFFQLFFFHAIQTRKMSFSIFQNEKMPFEVIKTRSSKSRKVDIFLKGLTHGFGSKFAIFPIFFSQAIYARKMSFTIFQKKNAFLGYKNKMFKKPRIYILPKLLTYGIGQKIAILPTFLLMQYRPGKQLLRYSRTKKCLSRLKIQEVLNVEKLTFF